MKSYRIWILLLLAVLLPLRGALAAGMLCPAAGAGGQAGAASTQHAHHIGLNTQAHEHEDAMVDGPSHDASHDAGQGAAHDHSAHDHSAHASHSLADHDPPHHDASAHQHADGTSHDHAGGADRCNLCSAFCSVTGLVSAAMQLAPPQPLATVFPRVNAAPSNFVPDGEERPPRSI